MIGVRLIDGIDGDVPSEHLPALLWAFVGWFPEAGLAIGPTIGAIQPGAAGRADRSQREPPPAPA